MRPSPQRTARFALVGTLVLLAALSPAAQALSPAAAPSDGSAALQDGSEGRETVRYTVEAHDTGSDASGQGDYWFAWNTTGEVRNPPALLPAGTHVVIQFVNKGAQAHNLHVGGGVDAKTEIIPTGESRTLEFNVTEDAPTSFEYWCDPHEPFGMKGNATSSRQRYQELTSETLNVTGHDEGGTNYWFTVGTLPESAQDPPILLKPGFTYTVHFTNAEASSADHNVHFGGPVDENTTLIAPGETETITFTVPSNATESFSYWCDPHRQLGMQGTVYTNQTAYQSAIEGIAGPGEEHMNIEALGVDYLAYWVGVIAFALLFVVYGVYFYLFKHGESATTTDHKDRTREEPTGQEARWNRVVGWILFLATIASVFTLAAAELGYI